MLRWVTFDRKSPGKRDSYMSSHMASMFSFPASQEQSFLTPLPRRPSLPSGLAEPPLTLQPAQSLFLPRLPAPCPRAVGLFFLWTALCPPSLGYCLNSPHPTPSPEAGPALSWHPGGQPGWGNTGSGHAPGKGELLYLVGSVETRRS